MRLPKGVTARQVDYWTSSGYIFPEDDPNTTPGRGKHRAWTRKDRRKLYALAELRRLGFEAWMASGIAEMASRPDGHGPSVVKCDLGSGVTVIVTIKELFGGADDDELCA